MNLRLLLLASLSTLVLACDPEPDESPTPDPVDADQDGFPVEEDCDDANASVHPDADEICDGLDNNCDDVVDDDAIDRLEGFRDADGDGYGARDQRASSCDPTELVDNGMDCNDSEEDVHPGAPEICDGLDNDCDRQQDEDPVDGAIYYPDADGDGYGDADSSVIACEQPTDAYETGDDCDDADAAVHPGAEEVCDGVDNDCDKEGDLNTVPGSWDSLAEAIEGVGDGGEVCVGAGTWTESTVVLSETRVSLRSASGSASTTLDLSSLGASLFQVSGDSDTELQLHGFTITGLEGHPGDGALANLEDGAGFVGSDLVFSDNDWVIDDEDTYLEGGMIKNWRGSVTLSDVVVRDNSWTYTGSTGMTLRGGIVRADDGEVNVDGLVMEGNTLTASGLTSYGRAGGLFVSVEDAQATLRDLDASDNTVDVETDNTFAFYGLVAELYDGVSTVSDGRFADDALSFDGESANHVVYATHLSSLIGEAELRDLEIENTRVELDGSRASLLGLLSSSDNGTVMDGVSVYNVAIEGDPESSYVSGLLYAHGDSGSVELSHIDVRGAAIEASSIAGTIYVVTDDASPSITNTIAAGNHLEAAEVDGIVTLYNRDSGGSTSLSQLTLVKNTTTSTSWGGSAGLYVDMGNETELSLSNSIVYGNTASGSDVWAHDLALNSLDQTAVSYLDVSDSYGDFEGSNLVDADPGFLDTSGSDPTSWDLGLSATSSLIDAGDPAVSDADGSRSDLGAYGGPAGSW